MHAVPVTPLMELWAPARRASGEAALAVMDGHLAVRSFFVGERYSIADIAFYAYTHVTHEGGFDLAPYPHLIAWLARVAVQPGHVPIARG
jgi:glutathione S-transferase